MKTIRLLARPLLNSAELAIAATFLKNGELLAIPTETVYGLAADLFQPEAIRKIFQTKNRPADNPLIAHISSIDELDSLIQNPHPELLKLADHFWPGPLTIVFERKFSVPSIAAGHLPTIAVRMPSHPCALQIIQAFGPLVAPSANISGRPSPTSAQHVLEDLDGKIPAIVDGGDCCFGIESTVVSISNQIPTLLRPGAIDRRAIEDVLKRPLTDPTPMGPIEAPGMKYRHYAPRAEVHLVDNQDDISMSGIYVPKNLTAQNLFSHFRKADREGYSKIFIHVDEKIKSNEALMNRLKKAAQR